MYQYQIPPPNSPNPKKIILILTAIGMMMQYKRRR